MPVVKLVTSFIEDSGWGWTETHYRNESAPDPNLDTVLDAYLTNVAPLRAGILGRGTGIVGIRASYPRNGAIASTAARININPPTTNASTDFAQSLAIQMVDSLHTRKKIIHVRGFWDKVEEDSGYIGGGLAAWEDRLFPWKDALINGGYGWLTKDPVNSKFGTVLSYASNPDNTITFTLAAPGLGAVPVGSTISVKFSRINNSNSVLNRQLLCEVLTAATVKTTAPIAAGEFTGQGRFDYRVTTFVAYSEIGSISIGTRPMGRPLFRAPGRSKARART